MWLLFSHESDNDFVLRNADLTVCLRSGRKAACRDDDNERCVEHAREVGKGIKMLHVCLQCGGVVVLYKERKGLTRVDNDARELFSFRNPVTGVTLVVHLVRVIYEMPELHEMLNALVHHRARDA